jgi:hypothetical protein
MPLPPTRYLDAGPGTPQANPNVAAAQAHAYANLGNTIAQLGEQGMKYAAQLKSIQDGSTVVDLFAKMEKDASDFSIGLMTREDTANWPQEWQKRADNWRQEAKKQKLSPGAMARFEEKFLDWNTRRSIQFETQAATKGIELARGKVANAYQFHLDNQNFDAARDTLQTAHESGIMDSVAMEKGFMEIDKIARHNDILADIDEDPDWLTKHSKPLPGYNMEEWNQLRGHARSVQRQKTYEVAGSVQDAVVEGKITTPEEVDAMAGNLRPTDRQELKAFLAKWQDIQRDGLVNDPVYQAAVLGEFDRKLADYVPVSGDDPDMPAVEMGALMRSVPAGPLREDMERRMQAVVENQQVEASSNLELMLDQVTLAAKTGKLGQVPETTVSVEQRVRGGFLRNPQTLADLGFSEDHVEQFSEAKSDNERRALLQTLWTSRGKAKKDIDPLTWQTAEAIRKGLSSFDTDPLATTAAQATVDARVGLIRVEMSKWAKLNPEAARDPEKIRAKLHEVTGLELRKPATRIRPMPTLPGLPEGDGDASDALLPPLTD